ncbi:MAG: hypothetical protein ACJAWW_000342 [Sulfurimonas sp.]|jgi:hypothetical protein
MKIKIENVNINIPAGVILLAVIYFIGERI